MFILLPLGHEQTTLRRAPWVTLAIALLCLGLQLRACSVEPKVFVEAQRVAMQIDDAATPEQQKALEAQLDTVLERLPGRQLGYRPDRDGVVAMLTSAFAHSGWFHLIGNLMFLYVVGCNMEDRWGRGLFLAFYLLGAIVAAYAFKLSAPQGDVPLVGASGAVAAAMGAFLVFYGRATIRFLFAYWIWLRPHWHTFQAPAWGAILLWFALQVLWAFLDQGSEGGVAYSAHVGGFVYGLSLAFVLKATGFDAKLNRAQEVETDDPKTTWVENEHAVKLMSAVDGRQVDLIRTHVTEAFTAWSRQGETERVTNTYRTIREQHAELELGEAALRTVVGAAARKGTDPLISVDVASQLIRQHPDSPSVPRAMWLAAEAHEALQRNDLAQRTLQNLIAAFPMEPLTAQARRKIGATSLRPPSA